MGVKFRLQGRTHDEGVTEEGCRERYCDLREEVTGDWRTLHNEFLRGFILRTKCYYGITSRSTRWAGHVARVGEKRNAYRILVGKPKGP